MSRAALAALAAVSVALSAPSPARARGGRDLAWHPVLRAIDAPAAPGSAQPQMSVSPRGVLLSWVERTGARASLRFAERTAGGWTAPRTAASGDTWFVNWADVPSVLRLDSGTLVAHWLQMNGAGSGSYAYDVRLAYSGDEGRTWSPSFTPHHDGTPQEHGFASLFQMPGGGLGLIWLDGRAMASGGGAHGGHGAGAMSVRYGAFDAGWTQTAEMPVDLRVCECCPTSAVVTAEGPLVAFRNRSDAEVRDIHVSRLVNGAWTESTAVHGDGWTTPACPVNGPMLSARGRDVAVAWFTVTDDVGHAFAAFSTDAGRTFGPPIRLDEASALGRVDIELLPDGTAVATWIEFAAERSRFSARLVHPSGRTSALVPVAAVDGARASGYPRVAWANGELVFAWTESRGGSFAIRTAVATAR